MNKALWAAQALLGFAFLMAGAMKGLTPHEALAVDMPVVAAIPPLAVKGIGLVEVLGAVGLILPSVLRIQPVLTPVAAGGLVLTMVSAAGAHIAAGEANMIAPSIVLGGLAAFVAWGRSTRHRIEPR